MEPLLRSVALSTGVRIEYAEQGDADGVPVVLLHGITDSWRSFQSVMPHLPASLRVFSLSQRGHGGSDRPGHYGTRDFAADAAAFIESLGLGRAIVVGHSMGSVNAMRLAIDRPELVSGLVLAGAFASFSDKPAVLEFHRDAVVPLQDPIDPQFVQEWQRSTLAQPVDEGFFGTLVDETLKVPAAVWHAAFGALLDDDFAAELHRIQAPTLVLWGDADVFALREDQRRLCDSVAGSSLVVYEGAGHALHWEQPLRVAGDIARFAAACAARAGRGAEMIGREPVLQAIGG